MGCVTKAPWQNSEVQRLGESALFSWKLLTMSPFRSIAVGLRTGVWIR